MSLLGLAACLFVSEEDRALLRDGDGDGVRNTTFDGDDCEDDDPSVGAPAAWYPDADGDGYGVEEAAVTACVAPSGFVATAADCDDAEPSRYPGAPDPCDGVDQDCDEVEAACALGANGATLHDGSGVGGFGLALAELPSSNTEKHRIFVGKPVGSGSVWSGVLGAAEEDGSYSPEALGAAIYGAGVDGDAYGAAMATGDFYLADGDHDLFIGAPGVEVDGVSGSGAIYLYDGTDASVPVAVLTMGAFGGRFGAALFGAATDSGYAGLLAGTPDLDGGRGGALTTVGYFEGEMDLSASPEQLAGVVFIADPDAAGAGAGTSVLAYELDGDGEGDVAIGAPGHDGGNGAVYIAPGPQSTTMQLGRDTWQIVGRPSDGAGAALASADADGGGYDDIFVGAPDSFDDDHGGAVYLLPGGGEIEGELASLDGAVTLHGPVGSRAGASLAVADIDDDGWFDLVIGAPGFTTAAGVAGGGLFVLRAQLSPGATYTLEDAGATVYGCEVVDCGVGTSVIPGDFDGDDLPDLAFGAPGYQVEGQNVGAVGFLFGVDGDEPTN